MSFGIGDTAGDYRIIEILGNGGMGEVFKVEHTVTRRVEAMKVLLSSGASGEEQRQRFLREIQVQASLNHPNIASVHNAFWVEDDLVMIMELVEGDSLQSLLKRGPIPIEAGLDCVCQALSALSYAHAHGVIHRDITPGNIIVSPEGTVKLTDFGLAKSPADQSLTQSGALMGSPHYMSPEQVRGAPAVDERSDIYSVGAVLYEIVTRRKAFAADSAFSTMRAHIDGAPVPPVEVNPRLPRIVSDIILKALRNDPSARFQTADEFRSELERVKQTPAEPVQHKHHDRGVLHFVLGAAAIGLLFAAVLFGIRQHVSFETPAIPEPIASTSVAAPAVPPPTVPEVHEFLPEPAEVSNSEAVAEPASPPQQAEEPVAEPKPPPQPRPRVKTALRASSKAAAAKPSALAPPPAEPPPAVVEPPRTAVPEPKAQEPPISAAEEPSADLPEATQKKGRFRKVLGKILHPFK
jgi:serine/threonine protein kinase